MFNKKMAQDNMTKKKESFEDKGNHTGNDACSLAEFEELGRFFLKAETAAGMKRRCDILLSLHLASRSQLQRLVCLSDMSIRFYEKEGPQGAHAIRFDYYDSKMNSFGRHESSGCLRNKLPGSCPVGAIALHLFYRFTVEREPMFSMATNKDWYNVALLPGMAPDKQQSYAHQRADTKKGISEVGILTSKV